MSKQVQELSVSARLPGSVMIFGCGYVGTALAARLLERKVRVGALTRNPEKAASLRAMGVAPVLLAELDGTTWHPMLETPFEAVVNCVSSAGGGLDGYWRSYYEGQRSIRTWAENHEVGTCLFTGSTSVYPQDGGAWVDEAADTSMAPETGKVLLQAERLLSGGEAPFKRWFVLRLAGIYGPGRHFLLDQILENPRELPGYGDYHLNLIHRDDIVEAIIAAIGAPEAVPSGVYNISDGNPSTKESIVSWLSGQAGVAAPRFNPDFVPKRLRHRGGRMPDRRICNKKALGTLGWSPRYPSFHEGYETILPGLLKKRNSHDE